MNSPGNQTETIMLLSDHITKKAENLAKKMIAKQLTSPAKISGPFYLLDRTTEEYLTHGVIKVEEKEFFIAVKHK